MKRFLIMPGEVRSPTDGQTHHVGASDLIKLYGLKQADCEVKIDDPTVIYDPELLPLGPLQDGRYREHLEQLKIGAFQRYHKARKLADFNESMRRPQFAERNRRTAKWLERTWPDFPAAYERMENR